MKQPLRTFIIAGAITFLAATVFPALSLAQTEDETSRNRGALIDKRLETARQAAKERLEAAKAKAQERRENAKTRLEASKLRACQNRETAMKNIMSRIGNRGDRHIELFSKIADRVKDFYVDKGLSVDNYDDLVADIDAKKAEAQAAVEAVKSALVEFKCDGEDPKGAAVVFKDLMKDQIEALQDFRKSVRNLIVAVKSAQSEANAGTEEGGEQ